MVMTVYSEFSFTAMALLAGSVQGVVVQTTALRPTDLRWLLPWRAHGRRTNGIFTNAAVHLWLSSYSSSASARAVREEGDQ